MSAELMCLPVFKTAHGRLAEGVRATPAELRYGFVLQEQVAIDTVYDIHARHVATAVMVLSLADQSSAWRVVPEFDREEQSETLGRHFDGLSGQYFQVHTTHGADSGVSRMDLEWYDLTPAEHQGTQWRWRSGIGLTGASVLDVRLLTMQYGDYAPALRADRPIQGRVSVDAGCDQTIVFPNGYDATEGSTPGRLFVHNFYTVPNPETDETERILSLTRLERVDAAEVGTEITA